MKSRNRVILIISVIILFISMTYIILDTGGKEELKGNINILVKEDTYEYILKEAKKFEIANKKVNINVFLNKDSIDINEFIKKNNIDIVQGNRLEYASLDGEKVNKGLVDKIINTYQKNFSDARLTESKEQGKYFSIPFTSNPLALFVREDILSKYGYDEGDIATWDDLLGIGIDIFNKTNGEMRIFNKKDWINISSLISIQFIEENSDKDVAGDLINDKLKYLLDKQLIGFYGEDNYLCRITSIGFVNEEKANKWRCINTPSINPGGNRFYDIGGDGLIIVNNNKETEALISSFIGYITSNIEELSNDMIKGEFFTSSVLAYKSKVIETSVPNVNGESPFIILTNISEKALPINNFDEYLLKLKEILTKWVI